MERRSPVSWKKLIATAGMAGALLLSLALGAGAAPLDDAKDAGLVGERPDGYVAAVQPNPPPDVTALVNQINDKRRAAYREIAGQENVPVEQVGALTAEKIRSQAPSGHHFLSSDGSWKRK